MPTARAERASSRPRRSGCWRRRQRSPGFWSASGCRRRSASGSAASGAGRAGFLALTIAVFVVIGALLEGLPALLIFGPILFPISRAVGVDPVHYGIVIVAAMGIAFFLPPVGVGLSIAAGIARVDIDDVSRTYVPYLVALLIGLALIAAFPAF